MTDAAVVLCVVFLVLLDIALVLLDINFVLTDIDFVLLDAHFVLTDIGFVLLDANFVLTYINFVWADAVVGLIGEASPYPDSYRDSQGEGLWAFGIDKVFSNQLAVFSFWVLLLLSFRRNLSWFESIYGEGCRNLKSWESLVPLWLALCVWEGGRGMIFWLKDFATKAQRR